MAATNIKTKHREITLPSFKEIESETKHILFSCKDLDDLDEIFTQITA